MDALTPRSIDFITVKQSLELAQPALAAFNLGAGRDLEWAQLT